MLRVNLLATVYVATVALLHVTLSLTAASAATPSVKQLNKLEIRGDSRPGPAKAKLVRGDTTSFGARRLQGVIRAPGARNDN